MCVIVHKPRDIENPSREIFQKCFDRNPHGAGILLHRQGTKLLEIHKGFMKFDDFYKAFEDLHIKKEDDAFFHFRITTSGGTCAENCHPFPISTNESDMKATRLNVPRAFIHNGVLGNGDADKKLSDTQLFVMQVMAQREIQDNLDDSEVDKIIEDLSKGNRFIVADAEKDIFKRYGTWTEKDKLWYSNMHWNFNWNDYYKTNINSKKYSSNLYNTYNTYYNSSYYGYSNNKSTEKLPDIDTILCPYCDKTMNKMMNGQPFYICPECGTIYNDDRFEIYSKKDGWTSLADLNEFDSEFYSQNEF